jgi:adenosine deaminase
MGITKALESFRVTLSVMQGLDRITRITRELCTDLSELGTKRAEIRFAPQLHCKGDIESVIDAAVAGLKPRFNLILCGLYGEPPEVIESLVKAAKTRPRVVGIDLAAAPLEEHKWGLMDYSEAFTKAKRAGLGRTVHAGEGRPAEEIRIAIEHLHAQRIGHGLSVLGDKKVADLVRERNVHIEACPTSNMHTGCIEKFEFHPMMNWLKEDIRFSLCCDNVLLSETWGRKEYFKARMLCDMTFDQQNQTQIWAKEALFS